MALALKAFVDKYQWRKVLLICDTMTNSAEGLFYIIQCTNAKRVFGDKNGLRFLNIDTGGRDQGNWDHLLTTIKDQARSQLENIGRSKCYNVLFLVIILFTRPGVLRTLMVSVYFF